MIYRIGSFNCNNLGKYTKKNIDIFYNIIRGEQFDIIALQEIKGKQALELILRKLGKNWQGAADYEVNDYAFIWNMKRVKLAEVETGLTSKRFDPHIYKQYRIDKKAGQLDIVREPFYGRFFPIIGGGKFAEIRIINCHIRYNKGVNCDSDLGQIRLRKNEFDVLTKSIYAPVSDKRYGTNRPAYTILLGDYNLNNVESGAGSPTLESVIYFEDGETKKLIETMQYELTTLKNKNDLNIYSNNYDHFTIDSNRFSNVTINCRRVDAINKYCEGNVEEYKTSVSDHLPIMLEIDLRKR